jgi:hypothetical protein
MPKCYCLIHFENSSEIYTYRLLLACLLAYYTSYCLAQLTLPIPPLLVVWKRCSRVCAAYPLR